MRSARSGPGGRALTRLVTALLYAGAASVAAQAPARPDTTVPAGTVVGSVVAAQTGGPLEDALVLLEPAPAGAMPPAPGGPASLEIDLRGDSPFRVSVGLVVVPIALEAVDVAGASPAPIAIPRADADAAGRARLMAEEDRRGRFLASDTRALTGADLTEAVTLGETDLFRALQRLPGVATRDDFTAELWTRGGRWTDTRVTFDGLPLFSPVHVAGVFAGVDPDAVGSAFFHPGVRPAASGEGAAATLDLRSRPAMEPGLHGLAELSVVSARAALEHGPNGAGIGWMLAARRSYLDLAADLLAALKSDSTIAVPYSFTDLAGRLDISLGGARALEVSGLSAADALRGTVPNLLRQNQGRWGDAAVQATLVTPG